MGQNNKQESWMKNEALPTLFNKTKIKTYVYLFNCLYY